MKHIKSNVTCDGIKIQCLDAILICARIFFKYGENFTITSITDGVHSALSLHYKGLAFDIRTRELKNMTPKQMADLLKIALGDEYDVVVENTHIHVEHDPK